MMHKSGPEGLLQWTQNYLRLWQAGYRSAQKQGYPSDIVILATPHADDVTKAPDAFMVYSREQLSEKLPSMAKHVKAEALEGTFYACPSKSSGRLQGTCVLMIQVVSLDIELPSVPIILDGSSGIGVIA